MKVVVRVDLKSSYNKEKICYFFFSLDLCEVIDAN